MSGVRGRGAPRRRATGVPLQAETPTQTLISDLDLQLTAANIFGVKVKSQESQEKSYFII
jgi:hypothetical protein